MSTTPLVFGTSSLSGEQAVATGPWGHWSFVVAKHWLKALNTTLLRQEHVRSVSAHFYPERQDDMYKRFLEM
eukprot:6379455-Amphidinium_carterae.2